MIFLTNRHISHQKPGVYEQKLPNNSVAGIFFPHGNDLFGKGRMNANGCVKLLLGRAAFNSDTDPLDDLSGIRADNMNPDNPIGFGFDNQLHHRPFTSEGNCLFHRAEFGFVDINLTIFFPCFCFRQTDTSNRWLGEYGGRHITVIKSTRFTAENRFRK